MTNELAMHEELSGAVSNAQWVSDETLPDPNPLPTIPGWNLLIRPVPIKQKTKGGIIIPEKIRDDIRYLQTCGRVLVVGNMAYKHGDFGDKPWAKVGDYVVYTKLAGQRFTYKGVKLILLPDRSIEMLVPDPDFLLS